MTDKEFNEVVDYQIKACLETLRVKAGEYAREDRLSNFKKAGSMQSCTPVRALWGMAAKHYISISDFVNDLEKGNFCTSEEWNEKIQDGINYLLLLRGLLVEFYKDKIDKCFCDIPPRTAGR